MRPLFSRAWMRAWVHPGWIGITMPFAPDGNASASTGISVHWTSIPYWARRYTQRYPGWQSHRTWSTSISHLQPASCFPCQTLLPSTAQGIPVATGTYFCKRGSHGSSAQTRARPSGFGISWDNAAANNIEAHTCPIAQKVDVPTEQAEAARTIGRFCSHGSSIWFLYGSMSISVDVPETGALARFRHSLGSAEANISTSAASGFTLFGVWEIYRNFASGKLT